MGSLVFPEFKQADFIGAMQAAQQYRANQFAMQQAQAKMLQDQQEAERMQQVRLLQGAALQGDPEAMLRLQGVAPEQAMQLEKFGAEQQIAQQKQRAADVDTQTSQLKMEDLRRQEMLRRFDQQIGLFEKAQANPQTLPVVMRMMVAQGLAPQEAAQYQLDPADIPEVISGLRTQKQMFESNEGSQRLREFQAFLEQREREFGPMKPGEERQAWDDFQKKMYAPGAGMQITNTFGDGSTQAATKGLQNDLQKDIRSGMESLATLQALKDSYNEGYRTYAGQAREFIGGKLSFAGVSVDKEFRQKAATWRNEMNQFFNAYKKEITGASAAVQEMEDLKASILSENTAPDLVPAMVDQLMAKISRNNAIASRLLQKGVPLGSEEYWRQFNSEVERDKKGAKIAPVREIEDFGNQLKAQGVPDTEIIRQINERFPQ